MKKTTNPIANRFIYLLVISFSGLSRVMPRKWFLKVCEKLGILAFLLLKKPRRRSYQNLKMALRKEKDDEVRDLTRKVFTNLAKNAGDVILALRIRSASKLNEMIEVEGLEMLEEASRSGRGVLLLSCHMGAFELLPIYFSHLGYKITVVGTRLKYDRLNRLLVDSRTSRGMQYIDRGSDTLKLIRALKNGGLVGILMDQNTKVKNIQAEFFGIPAYTPVGPTLLALRLNPEVIALAIRRIEGDRHRITIRPAVELVRTDDFEKDVQVNTQMFNDEVEALIRQDLTQWAWMHKRWRKRRDPKYLYQPKASRDSGRSGMSAYPSNRFGEESQQ